LHDDTGPSTSSDEQPDLLAADIHMPVNIGNPDEFTVGELAQRVLALTGSKSPIEFRPLPVDDPKVRRPDIRRARKLLHWEPTVRLEDGLKRTIPYFRESVRACT
jgi:nucleoside-diphosphate-sugar epimerase